MEWNGRNMTTKTAPLLDDTHKRIKDIQEILYKKRKVSMSIQDIIEYLIPEAEEGCNKIIEKIGTN